MFSTKSAATPAAQQQPVALSALRIQTAVSGLIIPKLYGTNRLSGNLIWKDGFQAIQHDVVTPGAGGGGGKGMGGGGGDQSTVSTTFTYQTAVMIGLCSGVINSVGKVWQDKSITSLAALGFSLFNGTNSQTPWAYLQSNFPAAALFYHDLAYLAAPTYQLNSSASMQNNSFELIMSTAYNPGASILDANPRDIVVDWLTNPVDGAGLPAENLHDLTLFSNYCVANGIFLSPIADSQTQARQFLDDIATITNSAWVWSGKQLNLIPYGDTAISGNGVTYSPNMTPLFDLTDDDFVSSGTGSGDPISTARINPADAQNLINLEIVDRANDYNTVPVQAKDQSSIDTYGLRQTTSLTAHGITSPILGQFVARLILQRAQYVRNTHSFTVGWKYGVLDPMDLVTLTDGASGLFRQLVRILTIDEDDSGNLSMTAEQVDVGVAHAPLYGQQASSGLLPDNNVLAPPANAPIIFAAPLALVTGLEMWMAVCGPDGFGGCNVWVSNTTENLKKIGRKFGNTCMGALTAPFTTGSDPDTTDLCSVDVSESRGVLLSGTQQDADLANTLCYIQDAAGVGEFISYETATLTGVSKYSLGTYIRRGLFDHHILSHVTGAQFARLDQRNLLKVPYNVNQIGSFIFIKLTAFNVHGAGEQSLSDVPFIAVLCPAPPLPPDVQNFSAIQAGEVVAFTWEHVNDNILIGYDIRFGPAGVTDWNAMLPLTEAASGAYEANASVPSGNWTFAIRARDIANQLSVNPAYSTRLITDNYPPVSNVKQDPAWPGAKIGCFVHYSGVLIPDSTTMANDPTVDIFATFVPNPVAQYSYECAGVSMAKVALVRVSAAFTGRLGPGETVGKPNPLLFARYSQDVAVSPLMWNITDTTLMWNADPTTFMWAGITDYELWTKGVVRTTYVQEKAVVNTSDGVMILQSFLSKVDQPIITDGANAVVVAPGGTRINFNTLDYLFPPFVSPTAQGTGLFATASNVDADGFTCHVFNVVAGGTDVGGTVNWSCHN